jgi:hypothetical protein
MAGEATRLGIRRPDADQRPAGAAANRDNVRENVAAHGVPNDRARELDFRELIHRSSPMPLIHGPEHERQAGALGSRDASHTVSATVDGFDFKRRRLRKQICGRGAKAATAHVSFCGC